MQLPDLVDVYRMIGTYEGGKTMTKVYSRIRCVRVPVSTFDKISTPFTVGGLLSGPSSEHFRPAGRSSTDVFLIPTWVSVKYDDELRRGRRIDVTGTVQQVRYTVDGLRDHDMFGYQDTYGVYCTFTQ